MIVKIGHERITAEDDIVINFKNNMIKVVDSSQTKFIYINPDEVKAVSIGKKQKGEMW